MIGTRLDISSKNILYSMKTRSTKRGRIVNESNENKNIKKQKTQKKQLSCSSCFLPHSNIIKCPCSHPYCNECLKGMFQNALNDRSYMPVKCCNIVLDQTLCQKVMLSDAASAYMMALKEQTTEDKMYCPRKDCSILIDLNNVPKIGKGTKFKCSACKLSLCVSCRASHAGLSCVKYQELPEEERNWEDIELHKLAQKHKYVRCTKCHHYVERISGCDSVRCRCGQYFCYKCGQATVSYHGACKCNTPLAAPAVVPIRIANNIV